MLRIVLGCALLLSPIVRAQTTKADSPVSSASRPVVLSMPRINTAPNHAAAVKSQSSSATGSSCLCVPTGRMRTVRWVGDSL